jgi:ACS family hexuronate transporter-like MFS transporter
MGKNFRWCICGLLFGACVLNYLDRQVLSVTAPTLKHLFHITNGGYSWIVNSFLVSYMILQPVAGRIIDWLTTRRSYALFVIFWSVASVLHCLSSGVRSFAFFRFLLGVGEAGNFPAAIKTVSEWFPPRERALAIGLFNIGSPFGALIAPPLIACLALRFGWQTAFIATGMLGFLWAALWLKFYQPPETHPLVTPEELAYIRSGDGSRDGEEGSHGSVWREALTNRSLWGVTIGRFLTDGVWWFYVFWLPSYLADARHFTLKEIGQYSWIPYLFAAIGSIFGGWLTTALVKFGTGIIGSRKWSLLASALMMPAALFVVRAPTPAWAIFFVCLAAFGHGAFSPSIMGLPADLFPKRAVATAYGISGFGAGLGGLIFQYLVGRLLDAEGFGYATVFLLAGILHPLAALTVIFTVRATSGEPDDGVLAPSMQPGEQKAL